MNMDNLESEITQIKERLKIIENQIDNHILTAIEKLDRKLFQLLITLVSIGIGGGGLIVFLINLAR